MREQLYTTYDTVHAMDVHSNSICLFFNIKNGRTSFMIVAKMMVLYNGHWGVGYKYKGV